MVSLTDAPGDYGSSNTVELKVEGKRTNDRGMTVELRKADESVLATVTFPSGANVDELRTSGAIAVTLTEAEVDGLKVRFVCDA